MKILNLYAGIGGNRKLWGNEHDITAVEWDEETAKVYQDYFPNDRVIVDNAHDYLLNNFKQYNFIWASPPCPTHSKARKAAWSEEKPVYPDMKLWQEIIFLQHHAKCKWVVENVDVYYEDLIPGYKVGRHTFWSNFRIGKKEIDDNVDIKYSQIKDYEKEFGYDLSQYSFDRYEHRKRLRNCVHPKVGKYVLDRAQDIIIKSDTEQTALEL